MTTSATILIVGGFLIAINIAISMIFLSNRATASKLANAIEKTHREHHGEKPGEIEVNSAGTRTTK